MKLFKIKLCISAILILTGLYLGLALTSEPSATENDTLTVDFGDYTIYGGKAPKDSNAAEALVSMCSEYGLSITYDADGSVKTIDGQPGVGDDRKWNLYTLEQSGNDWKWVKYDGDPSDLNISTSSSVSWGLCAEGQVPTSTVDATGVSYYGLGEAKTIVCLAPSCTETVCALGYEDRIVGTDMYSNYPESIAKKREIGIITDTGSYTSPNFEIIVKLKPDLVIGISSQHGHVAIAEKLRAVGINCIITGDGEDLQTVYDNTYMCGVGIGDTPQARNVTLELKEQVDQTASILASVSDYPTVMVALSDDKAPWVAGINTYVSDIYNMSAAYNTFDKSKNPQISDSVDGWKQITSESIVQANPQYIIVISAYGVSEAKYNEMIADLPAEWKYTDAYKNGNIYLVGDSAGDMMSRPSTRLAQLTELLGRIFHENAFSEVISVPKYIGDDYTDYLTYSKEL